MGMGMGPIGAQAPKGGMGGFDSFPGVSAATAGVSNMQLHQSNMQQFPGDSILNMNMPEHTQMQGQGQGQGQSNPSMVPFDPNAYKPVNSADDLWSLNMAPSSQSTMTSTKAAPEARLAAPREERLSHPRVILRPEVCGGLTASLSFRYDPVQSQSQPYHQAYITLNNTGDRVIRRVKVVLLPPEIRVSALGLPDQIPTLAPGEQVRLPLVMQLSSVGTRVSVKIEVKCDQGNYSGAVSISDLDLIQPVVGGTMTVQAFEAARKGLVGFNELSKGYPLSQLQAELGTGGSGAGEMSARVLSRLCGAANMTVVQGTSQVPATSSHSVELMLAGVLRGVGVYTSITIDGGATTMHLRLNCDDMVLISGVHDALRKILIS